MLEVDLQIATRVQDHPARADFETWVRAALVDTPSAELTVRLVDREESAELNQRFRSREGPTNVLSFAAELPEGIDLPFLGDIVICAPLVAEEAVERAREPVAHWAHLVIHGVLHLRGYDHQDETGAERMEALEVRLLDSLGFPDPYA